MENSPLAIGTFPRAILHIDGDAFFASCEQSRNPALKGKPVVTGKERGIAASMSYEAKARGVARGMRIFEIKKICPEDIILPSDYETYSLLSKRFFSIVRRYTPDVEEYSIDECFADLTGLQRPLRMSYAQIAEQIKRDLDLELGFTFSIGLAPTKVVAKIGSKWKKPSGLTVIPGKDIHLYLAKLPVEKVWGIGHQTTALLNKYGIRTALDFARKSKEWIEKKMIKPFKEIWEELNGRSVLAVDTKEKESYQSIQKVKTFTPPSNDERFIFAQLSKNIENACIKARRYRQAARGAVIFLRTQDFRDSGLETRFSRATAFPNEVIKIIEPAFKELFKRNRQYRSTGVILLNLENQENSQMDLFGSHLIVEKMTRLYEGVDKIKEKYGKHTLFLGSSFSAHRFSGHEGDRGIAPARKAALFKGETKRKRLAIPMFLGEVN
ncbi:DNA polymerase IV [Patescibacteria group bacterium]|nr:MAG: DNA polymerase IV [Patescibacteria group bacterium]